MESWEPLLKRFCLPYETFCCVLVQNTWYLHICIAERLVCWLVQKFEVSDPWLIEPFQSIRSMDWQWRLSVFRLLKGRCHGIFAVLGHNLFREENWYLIQNQLDIPYSPKREYQTKFGWKSDPHQILEDVWNNIIWSPNLKTFVLLWIFCTFWSRSLPDTTQNDLFSSCVDHVSTWQQILNFIISNLETANILNWFPG